MRLFGKGNKGGRGKPVEMGPGGNESGIVPVGQANVEAQLAKLESIASRLESQGSGGGGGEKIQDYTEVAGIDVPTVSKVSPEYDRGDLDARRSMIPTMELSVILNHLTGSFLQASLYGLVTSWVLHWGWKLANWMSSGKVWQEAAISWVLVMGAAVLIVVAPLVVVSLQKWEVWQGKAVQNKQSAKMWMTLKSILSLVGLLFLIVMTMRP